MEEEERLLRAKSEHSSPKQNDAVRLVFSHRGLSLYFISVHVILFFSVFTNIYLGSQMPARLTPVLSDLYSLRHIITSEHPIPGIRNSDFDGPPNNTTAAAWDALLQNFYIRASEEEVTAAGFETQPIVALKTGGYLASVGVYQDLHCLNQLRNLVYDRTPVHEGSHEVIAGAELREYRAHLDWCVESLRVSVLCEVDTSLVTYTWGDGKGVEALDARAMGERRCVDWGMVEEWAKGRSVGLTPEVVESGDGDWNV